MTAESAHLTPQEMDPPANTAGVSRGKADRANQLLFMRNGKMVEEGAAAELFKAPKTEYTRALFAAAFKLETVPEGVVSQ